MVGETGFEPATPRSQTECATGLRYSPTKEHRIVYQKVSLYASATILLVFSFCFRASLKVGTHVAAELLDNLKSLF